MGGMERRFFARIGRLRYLRPLLVLAGFLGAAGIGVILLESRANEQFGTILDGVWWAVITFSTTGYGDKVPVTLGGRLLAALTIAVGVGAMSLLSGSLASFLVERNTMARRGLMEFRKLTGHLIICGWRADMKEILVDIIRTSADLNPDHVVLVSKVEPERVQALQEDPELQGLKFVRGDYYSEVALERANVRRARKVVIISDTLESSSASEVDSKTVMAVITAKSLARDVYVTAEVLDRKYESYLRHVQCDEILFSRDFARQMLASSSATNGLSHIIQDLLGQGGDGSRLQTVEIPAGFVNRSYAELRDHVSGQDGRRLLLGLLTNTGSPGHLKIEALREAQKTSDVSQLVANMQKVKGLEVNQPVLLPPDDHRIQRHSMAIVLERG